MNQTYLVVVSQPDPVAPLVASEWGTPPATGEHVDGAAVRELGPGTLVVRRPTWHVEDDRLELVLPPGIRALSPTLVFPSIHRGQENIHCLTVHPIGNLGPTADLGGRPRTVNPTDPRSMAAVLRSFVDNGTPEGFDATFESTHHGPELHVPSFFAEIGYGTLTEPPAAAVKLLARSLRDIRPELTDRVALAVGGGHYAPHFTELALRRRWAFGHIVSRHSLAVLEESTARTAYSAIPGVEGIVYARAADAAHPFLARLGPRLRDVDAGRRESGETNRRTIGDAPSSGT